MALSSRRARRDVTGSGGATVIRPARRRPSRPLPPPLALLRLPRGLIRGLIRRLSHRLRRDTAVGAPLPGGETRKCRRWRRAATDPALGASQGRGLDIPRVSDPVLRPGGARLHSLPLVASWGRDERAELGRGSHRGVGFLSLPTRATPAICPGGGRSPACCPPGLPYLITRRAPSDPASPPPCLPVARLPWA